MSDRKNPFERPYMVALYQSLSFGDAWPCHYHGKDDAQYHSSSVRISEPVPVQFSALTKEDSVRNAVEALDAEERRIRLQMQEKLDQIQTQRANLLALTHQPETVST